MHRTTGAGAYAGKPSLRVLWVDGERQFCQVARRGTQDVWHDCIAVLPLAEHPTPDSIRALKHEYALKDHLDSNWALRPIELVREHGRTMLLLEYHVGEPLEALVEAVSEDMGRFLSLAAMLSAAVGKLHERGIVHKDIKPAHVLVAADGSRVWLTGFGMASRLPRERQAISAPEMISGTLSHMAPEQTGRLNRSIDTRSDLYALGVTLYQLVTGRLPFAASSPMEWVHCHVAKMPVPPKAMIKGLPAQVSAIIMKLLSKMPEDRYQTAASLERDLRRCLVEWHALRVIDDFSLGAGDTPDRLLIPENLYGRTREVDALVTAFDDVVTTGSPRLALVGGPPGIGKSAVVGELHEALLARRGLFASGKSDQLKQEIPYAALAQALQGLIRPLLGKTEAELRGWRDALHQALGPSASLLVESIPELKFLLGEQPPAMEGSDRKELVRLGFLNLIGIFARPEHPLVMFLDDLQWIDGATLDLLEAVLAQPHPQHVLLVGAYRSNEVHETHPLMLGLDAIIGRGVKVLKIDLQPLTRNDLTRLVRDAFRCEGARAMALAHLVHRKTAGNPFFAIQFIHELVNEGSIAFAPDTSTWSWDVTSLQAKAYTDNVADLMVAKLGRLAPSTRKALQEVACFGNRAEASVLALVHGTSEDALHAQLWEALRQDLLVQAQGTYRFVHDRIQEAAYSLASKAQRAEMHLRIGRILKEHRAESLFEIVGQLNRSSMLTASQAERDDLAELNLTAGKRAEATGAPAAALHYLRTGAELMTVDGWDRRRDLMFEIEFHRAECEMLMGDPASAEARLLQASACACDIRQRASAASALAGVYFSLGQIERGIAAGLSCLHHAGLDIPIHPTQDQAHAALDHMRSLLVGRSIDDLQKLPVMSDPGGRALMEVLAGIASSALHFDANLLALVVSAAVDLSLELGHCDTSCYLYQFVSALPGWPSSHFQTGLTFGRLGLALVEAEAFARVRPIVCQLFGMRVLPWAEHVATCRELLRRASDLAANNGNRGVAAACSCAIVSNMLVGGEPLTELEKEAAWSLEVCRTSGWGQAIEIAGVHAALVRNLRGLNRRFGSLDDAAFDDHAMDECAVNHRLMPFSAFTYLVRRLQTHFLAGDCDAAIDAASRAQPLKSVLPCVIEVAEHAFYSALAHAQAWEVASVGRRAEHVQAVCAYRDQLEGFERNCPSNFADRAALVSAELARIDGRERDAMQLYEQAIQTARENGFVQNEALAAELAGRFYAARGFGRIADTYLRCAIEGYVEWGAEGKVRQLEKRYPHLRQDDGRINPAGTVQTSIEQLDLAAVLRVSQAVTGETDLDRLVSTIMRLALEHAGADRCLLMLSRDGAHRVEAEALAGSEAACVALQPSCVAGEHFPASVLNFVVRSQEAVLLRDASASGSFVEDAYLRKNRIRSMLCMPLLKQGRHVGVIYLENSLATGAFTPDRVTLVKLLASDAAMSLESARLYQELREREAKVRRLVDSNIIGIVIWREDGRLSETNEAFLGITGYGRDELIGGQVRWTDLTPPEWQGADRLARAQARRSAPVQPYETELYRKDGTRVPVLIGGASFDGATDEGVAFVLDLTELKRAEQVARESDRRYHAVQLRLTDANRVASIGQLSASVAHEIKQPLSGISTNAGTCLRMLDADPPNVDGARETARRTLRDGDRALAVITRLQSLFSKKEFTPEPVDLNDAIREVLALSSSGLHGNRVILDAQLDEALPIVTGDRIQLQQVVLNLLRNASDAMADVQARPRRLSIRAERDGDDRVRVVVRDSGVGLAHDDMERIFDPFYTTKSGGMGIGLSVSRSIIERHRGRLWAEPNEGPGASFTFLVPTSAAPRRDS